MSEKNLKQKLAEAGNTVELLRNQQVGPNVYPGVPGEYSNWRDEQRAWAETAVLFNQSYHMVDLLVTGPDAFEMLAYLAPNSFNNFKPNMAKQFAPVTPEGYVIGDVIPMGRPARLMTYCSVHTVSVAIVECVGRVTYKALTASIASFAGTVTSTASTSWIPFA